MQNTQWQNIQNGQLMYLEEFLTPDEADILYQTLMDTMPWRQESITLFGKTVPQPRLQVWFGDKAYQYSGLKLEANPMPDLIEKLCDQCSRTAGLLFNSVLINLYRDGYDSMGWHQDNEPELGDAPVIASISLGAERKFALKHNNGQDKLAYQLKHGSLLIMAGDMQHYWKHALPKSRKVHHPRINLTFRHIK